MHYLSYTVNQISLYGSVQSQQSLFITNRLYICFILTSWYCGWWHSSLFWQPFVNLKVSGSNPLLGNAFTMNVISLHPAVAWYFARLFITKIWLALIRHCSKFRMPKFLLFDIFPQTLKISGENPVWTQDLQHLCAWGRRINQLSYLLQSKYA